MAEKGVEALLIGSHANLRYFSGFTGSSGYLLVTGEGAYLFTDSRYTQQAEEEVSECKVEELRRPIKEIGGFIRDLKISNLGFEGAHLVFDSFKVLEESLPGIHLMSLGDGVDLLRAVKEPSEVEAIERAAGIACKALMEVMSFIKEGVSERDIAIELEYMLRVEGADRVAFDTIVLSGERTALPHGSPSTRRIKYREPVLIDFGAVWEGYHSDETWSFAIGGFDREMDRIYRVVKEAHDRAIESIRPGMESQEVDRVARRVIEEAGYGKYFGHGTGHGVGLAIHERPRLSPYTTERIEEGMVFTIEPAIYIPGLGGIRIEDVVVVTGDGCRVLTKVQKDGALVC